MSGDCEKCHEHALECICENPKWLKELKSPSLRSEWGGTLCFIKDGKKVNMADHLNNLEREKNE
jgi:hypothetical protein